MTAGLLVLRWKAAPGAEGVLGYRVLLQAGGSEGFREVIANTASNPNPNPDPNPDPNPNPNPNPNQVIADTGKAEPVVRLDGLSAATWYEVKVCAHPNPNPNPKP